MFGVAGPKDSKLSFFAHTIPSKAKVATQATEDEELFFTVSNGTPKGVWYTIHTLAATNNHEVLLGLLKAFSTSFMCVKCMIHMQEHIAKKPPPSIEACRANRRELFDWTINFRNAVTESVRLESGYAGKFYSKQDADRMYIELTDLVERNKSKYLTSGGGGDCKGCSQPQATTMTNAQRRANIRWVQT